jgi:Raf kinase inhibitor-like YbhB/YbcL family protein
MSRLAFVMMSVGFALAACSGDEERPTAGGPRNTEEGSMRLTSTAFEHEGSIPATFTCDGPDVSPALSIEDIPAGTVSLALVMDDPDAPRGTWDHWVVFDIPTDARIPEGVAELGTPGSNSWGHTGYGGPCPPGGTHRYFFVAYALDTRLGLAPGADKAAVLDAIEGHVLAEATLMGRYSRS